jgi:acyl-CoA synthetase (AMP-forming)/AMP-acid ligase II
MKDHSEPRHQEQGGIFDMTGVVRGKGGIKRYEGLPRNLVQMFRAAVLGYLGEHIADFKVPQYVAVSSTPLPRNPGGKLLKRRLREDVDWAAAFRR